VIAERILADALFGEGYEEEAQNTAKEALALGRQTLDTRSPDYAFFLTSWGQILKGLGKLRQAEDVCQSALQILQRTEATHKGDLATAYQNVAIIQASRLESSLAAAASVGRLCPLHENDGVCQAQELQAGRRIDAVRAGVGRVGIRT